MDRPLIGLVHGALLMSGIHLLLTFSWRTLDLLNLLISLDEAAFLDNDAITVNTDVFEQRVGYQ